MNIPTHVKGKEFIRIGVNDEKNYRKLAEKILITLGQGKIVQLSHHLWTSSSTCRTHVFAVRKKISLLFPNRTNIVSRITTVNNEAVWLLYWSKEGEVNPLLTSGQNDVKIVPDVDFNNDILELKKT